MITFCFIALFRFSLQGRRYIDQPLRIMFSQRILPERAGESAEIRFLPQIMATLAPHGVA